MVTAAKHGMRGARPQGRPRGEVRSEWLRSMRAVKCGAVEVRNVTECSGMASEGRAPLTSWEPACAAKASRRAVFAAACVAAKA